MADDYTDVATAALSTHVIAPPPAEEQTGSDIESIVTPSERESLLATLGTLNVSPKQNQILGQPPPLEAIAIKPTGEPYVPAMFYRRILNEAFGRGRWAQREFGPIKLDLREKKRSDSTEKQAPSIMYQEYGLIIKRVLVSTAIGECEYHPNNARMTYGDAAAGTKSNGLMRLCKELGIYSECWDPRWCASFKAEHCVKVRVDGTNKPQWRRVDQEPFWNEKGVFGDSPNRDRYNGPPSAKASSTPRPASRETRGVDEDPFEADPFEATERRSADGEDPIETIATTRDRARDGGLYGVKGSRSGEAFTDDPSLFRWARDCCSANRKVRLSIERRTHNGREIRWLSEINPVKVDSGASEIAPNDPDIPF
jgi:hypothetical protein